MSVKGQARGAYSRRKSEDPKYHVRDRTRETEAEERSTGRKVRIACNDYFQSKGIQNPFYPGSWRWDESDARREWVSRKPAPAERLRPPKQETFYEQLKREAQERRDAEAMERHWQEEWDRDMAEIERERRTKERRAAGLIRRRHNKRDAPQGTPEGNTGQAEGTPPCGNPTE
jgi:hypothetical protein